MTFATQVQNFIHFLWILGIHLESLSQEYLIKSLLEYGIEQTYSYIIADVYQKSHFEVLCDEGLSKEFELTVGEKTGDPASPFWFILALDKTLWKVVEVSIAEHRTINKPIINQNRIAPIPVGGFADDVYLASLYEHVFQAMVIAFKEGIISTNLMVRSDKCGLFYERRSTNRWYKAKRDVQPSSVSFSGEEVKVHERHEPLLI